jgi:formiminotetrahydrofolate cyclodeaminase
MRGERAGTALAPSPTRRLTRWDVQRGAATAERNYNRGMSTDPAMSFRELTLGEFVDRLASADPVPGGGSASAVAASLGAALVAMVAALSEDRPKYAAHADLHIRTRATGQRLAARFLDLADEDAAAYAVFGAAMKLPKTSDEEQAARRAAISSAARVAAEIPLLTVEACLELVAAAE